MSRHSYAPRCKATARLLWQSSPDWQNKCNEKKLVLQQFGRILSHLWHFLPIQPDLPTPRLKWKFSEPREEVWWLLHVQRSRKEGFWKLVTSYFTHQYRLTNGCCRNTSYFKLSKKGNTVTQIYMWYFKRSVSSCQEPLKKILRKTTKLRKMYFTSVAQSCEVLL